MPCVAGLCWHCFPVPENCHSPIQVFPADRASVVLYVLLPVDQLLRFEPHASLFSTRRTHQDDRVRSSAASCRTGRSQVWDGRRCRTPGRFRLPSSNLSRIGGRFGLQSEPAEWIEESLGLFSDWERSTPERSSSRSWVARTRPGDVTAKLVCSRSRGVRRITFWLITSSRSLRHS